MPNLFLSHPISDSDDLPKKFSIITDEYFREFAYVLHRFNANPFSELSESMFKVVIDEKYSLLLLTSDNRFLKSFPFK